MSVEFKKCYICNKDMEVDSERFAVKEKHTRYFCKDNCFLLYTIRCSAFKEEHPDDTGAIIYPQKDIIDNRFEILDL